MSKPRCTSDWNSCRRWVPQDEAVQFETPLDQLKQNIQDTLIKPNQEALVSQLLLIRSCLDSCCSFVFVVALVYVSYFVFVRHVRNSFLNLKSARWNFVPPIHTTLFPFCPIPPPAGSWRWRSGVRNASVKPEQRSFLADVPKEGWRAGTSKFN